MAQIGPYGLRPAGDLSASGSFSGKVRWYPIKDGAAKLVAGQIVKLTATGLEGAAVAATGVAASDEDYIGVLHGVHFGVRPGQPLDDVRIDTTVAADTNPAWGAVIDDPHALFTVTTFPVDVADPQTVKPVQGQVAALKRLDAAGTAQEAITAAATALELTKGLSSTHIDLSVAAVDDMVVRVVDIVGSTTYDDAGTMKIVWEVLVCWNKGHQLLSPKALA